jgi:Tfp pilus assembly ATPase PilU
MTMGFNDLLKMPIEKEGSDLFLTIGTPPEHEGIRKNNPCSQQNNTRRHGQEDRLSDNE